MIARSFAQRLRDYFHISNVDARTAICRKALLATYRERARSKAEFVTARIANDHKTLTSDLAL